MTVALQPQTTMGFDWQRVRAVMRRQGYVQKRGWHRWFDVLVWPVVDTVIWGSIGLFVDQQGGAGRRARPTCCRASC